MQKKIYLFFALFTVCMYLSLPADESTFDSHGKVSYSCPDYRGQPLDHKLVELMKMTGGVFIEAGAWDGKYQSNTKLLEEFYGWTGILVEPSECLYSRLCDNRPNSICFQCALGSFEEHNSYKIGDFDGNAMAGFGTKRKLFGTRSEVLVRSLQSILDETGINHVNFFSLDTEGYELNILKGIDFNKTTFDFFLIEIYKSDYENIIVFLSDHGYDLVGNFSNYNLLDCPKWDGTHNDYLFKRRSL